MGDSMRPVLLLIVAFVSGCGDRQDRVAVPTATRPTSEPAQKLKAPDSKEEPKSKLPQTLKQRYGGRDASEWGRELLDANGTVSDDAAVALRHIGPEALRFVLEGFDSPYAMVRLRSVASALVEPDAAKYPEAFAPALVKLLSDSSPQVRGRASLAAARCGFVSLEGDVKKAAARETNAETKRQMTAALAEMTKKQ